MISLNKKIFEDIGFCWVGNKLCPSPAYMAEIIKLTKDGMNSSIDSVYEGKSIKITRDTAKNLLAKKFDQAEFIVGLLNGRDDEEFNSLMNNIEGYFIKHDEI